MNVSCSISAMGSHFIKLTPYLRLFFLCVIFVNNVSVSLTFSVSGRVNADDTGLHSDVNQLLRDDIADDDDLEFEPRTDFEEHELENIKKTMIQGLGFKRIPDVTKMNVSQEEYARMYNVYLRRLEEKQTDDSSHLQVVPKFYTFHQKERHTRRKRRRGITQMTFNLTTDLPAVTENVAVEHAMLRLLAPAAETSGIVRVQVYQVLGRQRRRLVDEKDVHLAARNPKWCEFDVTRAVRSWLDDNERNLGLELHCPECSSRGHYLLGHPDNHKPVINALLTPVGGLGRDKRSAESPFDEKNRKTDCHSRNNKRCCRHKMDFDFIQLGLDFIIQPKKFDGGICKGRCPPYYNAAHNHAILQSLMWKKNKNLTPRVCCAPSKLTHLEILTVDEDDPGKLIVKTWDDMIVQECTCT